MPDLPPVCFAYVHPAEVAHSFHRGFAMLLAYDMQHDGCIARGGFNAVRYGSGGIAAARNKAAAAFLDHPQFAECEWLFWLDTDMGFTPTVLNDLLTVADPETRPIVGGLCFAQEEEIDDGMSGFVTRAQPTIYVPKAKPDGTPGFARARHFPVNELIAVGATGSACILIHRSVFTKIRDKYGDAWYDEFHDSAGAPISEDLSFCVRARTVGADIFVHSGIRTSHLKKQWVQERDFWEQRTPRPATERVAVLIPALSRPDNVRPLVESLVASTGLATPYFVCDRTDIPELAAVLAAGAREIVYDGDKPGTFAEKVNAGYRATSEPWIFLAGDDVRFRPGWLDHALEVANLYGRKVIGTNDLGNPRVMRGEHATHMLIARSYIDEQGASWDGPGVVCHEGYRHWFVDDEIVNAAKQRGVWGMALGSIVEHLHSLFGKAADDDVYRLGQSHAKQDAATYRRRLARAVAA